MASRYRSADLRPGGADKEIALEDQSVDAIICFHVLEHVDDRKALPELFRILKPGGRAIFIPANVQMIPVNLAFILSGQKFRFVSG